MDPTPEDIRLEQDADRPLISGISEYDRELEILDKLLRGELAAVEAYTQCIARLDTPDIAPELEAIRRSHEIRAEQIHNHIALLGGEPSEGAGLWGAFARVVEGGALLLGTKPALDALEAGELHGIREYHDTAELEPETRAFVRKHLRPEQERTHEKLGELIRRVP